MMGLMMVPRHLISKSCGNGIQHVLSVADSHRCVEEGRRSGIVGRAPFFYGGFWGRSRVGRDRGSIDRDNGQSIPDLGDR